MLAPARPVFGTGMNLVTHSGIANFISAMWKKPHLPLVLVVKNCAAKGI